MNKKRKEYIESCEISEVTTVTLGGFPQRIAIEGEKKGTPVVLFLHGGPGFNVPFCVGARGCFPQITQNFTAVYWDQLGCGINNRKLDDTFSVKTFSAMAEDLVRYLKGRFQAEKLFLFGISYGSVLALDTALALPDLVDGVFTAGQVLLPPLCSEEFFAAVEHSSAPRNIKAQMREIRKKEEKSNRDITLISKTARKYTYAYCGASGGAKNPVKEIFASKDYRFRDALACFINGYRFNKSLMAELSKIDLREKFARVEVPYEAFGGSRDLVTPVKDVAALFSELNKENLQCVTLDGEGHIPSERTINAVFEVIARAARL